MSSSTEEAVAAAAAVESIQVETKPKQPELAKHDSAVLDLAFVMDCTGSMGSYIESATESIRQIVEEIVALEKSDIQLALVEYRDHPPQEETFVARSHDFTGSIKEMKKWLEGCQAVGGGDHPEAVADGLQEALKLNWRETSTKICVLIADAPPHGLRSCGDSFPEGCPEGIDPMSVVKKMVEKGITLYCVGCEPSILPDKDFFTAIAFTTGGQYVPLRNAKLLSKVIVGGAIEEISLEKLMEDVQLEVDAQREQGVTDERLLAECVELKLKSRGTRTHQIQLNNTNLERASDSAMKYSKMTTMSELREVYKSDETSGTMSYMSAPGLTAMMSKREAPLMRMARADVPIAKFGAPAPLFGPPMVEFSSSASYSPDVMCAPAKASMKLADEPVFAASANLPGDSYSTINDEINTEQVERLVQKALHRKKK